MSGCIRQKAGGSSPPLPAHHSPACIAYPCGWLALCPPTSWAGVDPQHPQSLARTQHPQNWSQKRREPSKQSQSWSLTLRCHPDSGRGTSPFLPGTPLSNGAWDPLRQGWQGTEAARGCPGASPAARVLFGEHAVCQPEPHGTGADLHPSWHGLGLDPLSPAHTLGTGLQPRAGTPTHPAAPLRSPGRAPGSPRGAPRGCPRRRFALPRHGTGCAPAWGWGCVLRPLAEPPGTAWGARGSHAPLARSFARSPRPPAGRGPRAFPALPQRAAGAI